MTADERADELQRFAGILEVDFSLMHGRIEALAGRSVWSHELANYAAIIEQVRQQRPPTADEWIAPLAMIGTSTAEETR
jgi:hypothetical protein